MPFTHPVPDWNAQGAEPPESLKTTGWAINQKPPADYFNWFFYNSAKALIELQLEAVNIDQKGVPDGLATLGADGKVPASQLNVSAPPDASTTVKGVVQLSNSTTSTSEALAATPKAVKDVKDGLSAQIGILSGLNTTNKADLVSATNEVNSKTGTLSSLNTTAKTNLVAAVNELFTFANDGKSKWSSVIGSPLVSSDTFTQMQNKTQTIKDTLATNLTAKGQSSTGTETLTALAGKVSNITQNPFASYSVTSKAGNTTGIVGINSDGEIYTNSSGTVSRRNYGGTVLETFPSKGGVVWFSEDKWCGRPSTNMPVIYDSNNTIIHTTLDGSYGSDQSSFNLNYLSFNGEYAFSFPTSLNQRIYYKSKSGSTTTLTWPWSPVLYPICVYNKSTQSGAIIGLGNDQYAEIREMFYQRGNTISSTTMRGLDIFLFVPFKV